MATTQIELEQAAGCLPSLVADLGDGDEIILTRDDVPVARIVGYSDPARTRRLDTAKGLITIAEDFDEPLEEFEEYMR